MVQIRGIVTSYRLRPMMHQKGSFLVHKNILVSAQERSVGHSARLASRQLYATPVMILSSIKRQRYSDRNVLYGLAFSAWNLDFK